MNPRPETTMMTGMFRNPMRFKGSRAEITDNRSKVEVNAPKVKENAPKVEENAPGQE